MANYGSFLAFNAANRHGTGDTYTDPWANPPALNRPFPDPSLNPPPPVSTPTNRINGEVR